jgi:hypothetical protein
MARPPISRLTRCAAHRINGEKMIKPVALPNMSNKRFAIL